MSKYRRGTVRVFLIPATLARLRAAFRADCLIIAKEGPWIGSSGGVCGRVVKWAPLFSSEQQKKRRFRCRTYATP